MLIGEIAKKAGVSKDTVRLYEKIGLVQSTPRTAGSRTYADYAPETIQQIEDVRYAQSLGVTLRQIKTFTDAWTVPGITRERRHALLSEQLAFVRKKQADLRRFEQLLVDKIALYSPKK